MPEPLLRLDGVGLERGVRQLLVGVDLAVQPGEAWQLLGSNGSGKTSLLRAVAGLARLGVSGTVTKTSSVLYQGHLPGTKPLLTARENLRWHPSGCVEQSAHAIDHALGTVGLVGCEDLPVHRLSAGQQRRVALARLWLTDARLWLLDEPFTAIDTVGTSLLEQRLQKHCEEGGGVLFTSHQPNSLSGLRTLDLAAHAP